MVMKAPRTWTIEVKQADGSWLKVGDGRVWSYISAENAEKDMLSKAGRRFFKGCECRVARLDG